MQIKPSKHIKFQNLTLFGQDEEDDEGKRYNVHMFGVNAKGQSLHVKVEGFKPYCYIRPPTHFKRKHMEAFTNFFDTNMRKHAPSIVSIELVTKTAFEYYQLPRKYIKITFHTKQAMSYCRYMFLDSHVADPDSDDENDDEPVQIKRYFTKKKIKIDGIDKNPYYYRMYECHIDPILRFVHNTGIKACGWVQLMPNKYSIEIPKVSSARTQISVITQVEHILPDERDDIAPLCVLSFDLECTSIDGGFPQPDRPGDKIIQCGYTMHIISEDNSQPFQCVSTLKQCAPVKDSIIRYFDTEQELLVDIVNVFDTLDPDIITGYNINQFDIHYLDVRCKMYGLDIIGKLSRFKDKPAKVVPKIRQSAALGYNKMHILTVEGRVVMDLLKIFQSDFKLQSYKLDVVAEIYLGLNKNDVTPQELFKLYNRGTPDDIARIADYCRQDCILVNKLMDKMCFIMKAIGMANVCSVPLDFLFLRGQGIKGTSLVSRFCQQIDYIVPYSLKNNQYIKFKDMTPEERENMKKVQGAVVITANKGLHMFPVEVNDYSSLYPSSMISHNLSNDTYITNKSPGLPEDQIEHRRWTDNEGVKHHYRFKKPDVEPEKWKKENWPTFNTPEEKKTFMKDYNTYQTKQRKGRGILPQILMTLLEQRGLAKLRKKEEIQKGNEFMASIHDGYQLALKTSANSLYGLTGTLTSDLCCKPVAACTTATGRELLMFSDEVRQEVYPDSELIYGDSVSADTPLLVRMVGEDKIYVKTISDLSDGWVPYDGFKVGDLTRIHKEQSFVEMEVWCHERWSRIKRVIRHKTTKQMYRILTHTGCVDVTEDHSLLSSDGDLLKPTDVSVGTELLHSFPDDDVESEYDFKYRKQNQSFVFTDKVEAQKKYMSLRGAQFYSVIIDVDYDSVYTLTANLSYDTNPIAIKKIIKLPDTTDDTYVYDLETEDGIFHAGIGSIVVKNTDSIMVKYKIDGLDPTRKDYTQDEKEGFVRQSMACGIALEKVVSDRLPWPHCLEREKTFYPFLLFSKKRYSAVKYEDPTKPKVIHSGSAMTRRDNANLVKLINGPTLDTILLKFDIEGSITYVREQTIKMLKGQFDLDAFKISVALKKVKKEKQAQHILAERITERDPGDAPQMNDRMFYIYVKLTKLQERMVLAKQNCCITQSKNGELTRMKKKSIKPKIQTTISAGYRIETPKYIKEHNLPIDYYHYFTNQLLKPVTDIFKTEYDGADGARKYIFGDIEDEYFLKSNNIQKITDFF